MIRSSDLDWIIRLYLKVLKNCMFFFKNRFCFVHILFIRMMKFQFLAQFSEDHLPRSYIPVLIVF